MTIYNQAFKDALQYMSKYVYMHKTGKMIQNNIAELSHWIDANPKATQDELLTRLAETVRVKPTEIRY